MGSKCRIKKYRVYVHLGEEELASYDFFNKKDALNKMEECLLDDRSSVDLPYSVAVYSYYTNIISDILRTQIQLLAEETIEIIDEEDENE